MTDSASNPYAVSIDPAAESVDPAAETGVCGVSADGELIVVSPAVLPPICAVAGSTENLRVVTKTVYWAPPWTLWLIVVSCLPGAVVYLILRRDLTVRYFLSREVWNRNIRRTAGGALAFLAGIVLLFAAAPAFLSATATTVLMLVAFGGMVGGALLMNSVNVIRVSRHDGRFYLRGLPDPLLEACRADRR